MNDSIKLLNLKEEDVESIDSYITNNILYINLILRKRTMNCPRCMSKSNKVESYRVKQINHPMLNDMKCIVNYKCRRYKCKICNQTFNEENTFLNQYKHSTSIEEYNVLNMLKNPDYTFTMVAEKCNISVTKAQYIFDKHVNIKRRKLPKILSIDEFYDPSTGEGKYDCLWIDFENDEVIDVLPDRTKYSLQRYLQGRTTIEKENVEYVSIDMWEPYREISQRYFKKAKICVDSFHVIKNINHALDKIRIRVMNKVDYNSVQYYLLKKFNFLLLKSFRNISKGEKKYNHRLGKHVNLYDILNLILNIDEDLNKAYFLKENYLSFNRDTKSNHEIELNKIIQNFQSSLIPEYTEIYKMLMNWKQEIINSFSLTSNGRRINNSVIESKNSIIKRIIRNANGMRNFYRLRNRIMYCLNNESFCVEELENTVKRPGNPRGTYNKNK